jgi:hypothetical protein
MDVLVVEDALAESLALARVVGGFRALWMTEYGVARA